MTAIWYLCAIVGGYLLGNFNTAAIIARAKGFDIRTKGSGNAGASNAMVTMGKAAGVTVALVDILKAFLPVFVLAHLVQLPEELQYLPQVTGTAVILGHMFPFWMHFKGGKGYASLLGMALALDWRVFLGMIAVLGILLLTTRYIALATITCAIALPVISVFLWHSVLVTVLFSVLAAIIVVKHIPNLKRMKNHTEIKLGDKVKDSSDESAKA